MSRNKESRNGESGDRESRDNEFGQYLQGKSDLSRHYAELPEVKLPDHLDAAILAEAHRAVGAGPGNKRSWTMPLSLVATLFVVVMAGLMLPDLLRDTALVRQYQAGRDHTSLAARPAASPQPIPETISLPANMPAPEPAPAPVETPGRTAGLLAKKQAARDGGVKMYGQLQAESASAQMQAEEKPAAKPAPALPEPPSDKHLTNVATPAPAESAESAAAIPAAPAVAAVGVQQLQREAAGQERMHAAERKLSARPQQFAATEAARPLAAGVVAPDMALADQGGADAMKEEAGSGILQPEAWLKRIRKLKQDGKTGELKKELAAFKRRYPAYPLPRDMLTWGSE